jgi:hypothetical protein
MNPRQSWRRFGSYPNPQIWQKKQLDDGSWKYPGKTHDPDSGANYFLIETFRNLRVLVEMYGYNRNHPAILKAAEFLFSCQTPEGDNGAILELLIKSGFE